MRCICHDNTEIFRAVWTDKEKMNLEDFAYSIFHIPGYNDVDGIRASLYSDLDLYLSSKMHKLDTQTILISSREEYDKFNSDHFKLYPKNKFKWGELGIWASNLLAIKNFLNTDKKYLMLMEDDILVEDKDKFLRLLSQYMDNLPYGWEIFSYYVPPNQYSKFDLVKKMSFVEGISFETAVNFRGVNTITPGSFIQDDAPRENKDVVESYQDWSMLCWILNRESAEKILKDTEQNGILEPIDWYIFDVAYLNKTTPLERVLFEGFGQEVTHWSNEIKPRKFKTYTLSPSAEKGCSLYLTESTFQQREVDLDI